MDERLHSGGRRCPRHIQVAPPRRSPTGLSRGPPTRLASQSNPLGHGRSTGSSRWPYAAGDIRDVHASASPERSQPGGKRLRIPDGRYRYTLGGVVLYAEGEFTTLRCTHSTATPSPVVTSLPDYAIYVLDTFLIRSFTFLRVAAVGVVFEHEAAVVLVWRWTGAGIRPLRCREALDTLGGGGVGEGATPRTSAGHASNVPVNILRRRRSTPHADWQCHMWAFCREGRALRAAVAR